MRHALTKYPDASYIWFLDQNALIMDPKVSIHRDIMSRDHLDKAMIRGQSVALPDSVIKTWRQLSADQVDLVLTQDKGGMSHESMILRNGDWAEFFLDTWYDPLIKSYNFKKAELHALVSLISPPGEVRREGSVSYLDALTPGMNRNTLSSGTVPSWRRWRLYRRRRSTRTATRSAARRTRRATSWCGSTGAPRRARRAASRRRCGTGSGARRSLRRPEVWMGKRGVQSARYQGNRDGGARRGCISDVTRGESSSRGVKGAPACISFAVRSRRVRGG